MYRCDRCPLIIEVGGGVAWDHSGYLLDSNVWIALAFG
jgi:hypothetical protein